MYVYMYVCKKIAWPDVVCMILSSCVTEVFSIADEFGDLTYMAYPN